jgi:hypothetical protein
MQTQFSLTSAAILYGVLLLMNDVALNNRHSSTVVQGVPVTQRVAV